MSVPPALRRRAPGRRVPGRRVPGCRVPGRRVPSLARSLLARRRSAERSVTLVHSSPMYADGASRRTSATNEARSEPRHRGRRGSPPVGSSQMYIANPFGRTSATNETLLRVECPVWGVVASRRLRSCRPACPPPRRPARLRPRRLVCPRRPFSSHRAAPARVSPFVRRRCTPKAPPGVHLRRAKVCGGAAHGARGAEGAGGAQGGPGREAGGRADAAQRAQRGQPRRS